MNSCSEYVASGHSDKVADLIASYLLDEYIRHDPKTRFAMEVQLKDHTCNLAGEVTSAWHPSDKEIGGLVRSAIRKVGYTAEYATNWPEGATLNADKVIVNNFIGQQSPDIAQGVDREGWGDQGTMMGMATSEEQYGYMPRDRYFAHEIGRRLYDAALTNEIPIGLDIKTLVSLKDEDNAEQVIVAAPMLPGNESTAKQAIKDIVYGILSKHHYKCNEPGHKRHGSLCGPFVRWRCGSCRAEIGGRLLRPELSCRRRQSMGEMRHQGGCNLEPRRSILCP